MASRKTAGTVPSLPLLDPLKRFHFGPVRRKPKAFPRITCIGLSQPTPVPDGWIPSPDDELDATRLLARLHALQRALGDLDAHAKRLARWKARRDFRRQLPNPPLQRFSPLRPGHPPGHRKRARHEVDGILRECHSHALYALREDTS